MVNTFSLEDCYPKCDTCTEESKDPNDMKCTTCSSENYFIINTNNCFSTYEKKIIIYITIIYILASQIKILFVMNALLILKMKME